jgi:hypothetical protein
MAARALLIAQPTERHRVRMSQRQIVQALRYARSLRRSLSVSTDFLSDISVRIKLP